MKLSSASQVQLDEKSTMDKSPDELGIDSLVAVDLMSWFRRELDLDITVMKILNTPSFGHLLVFALEFLKGSVASTLDIVPDSVDINTSELTNHFQVIEENPELILTESILAFSFISNNSLLRNSISRLDIN